jgi:hypothetical protein
MGFTIAAYLQSIAQNSHLELNALSDQHLITSGKDITVPDVYDKLMAVYASGITINRAQISSPTMRKSLILDGDNINIGVEPLSPPPFIDMFDNPRQLKASEGLRALATQGSAGAEIERVVVFLGDGKLDTPTGEVMTVKCTGTTTLGADAWSLVPLTFSQQLESGRYQIVGARFEAAGAVAGRLVIPGSAWRPGAIATDLAADILANRFQTPISGIWGEFSHSFPPQAEFLSVSADTAETVYLDLIKIA